MGKVIAIVLVAVLAFGIIFGIIFGINKSCQQKKLEKIRSNTSSEFEIIN